MLISAVILSALSMALSGAALALALAGTQRREAPKPAHEAESEEERARAERADRRMKEGLANMMDFDPFRKGDDL